MNKLKKLFNNNPWEFIWGISANGVEADAWSANDFDIMYNTKTKKYHLGIETAFLFDTPHDECEYLLETLDAFTKFMISTNRDINKGYPFYCSQLTRYNWAYTIEELYRDFNIFVKGYCAYYKY